MAFFAGAALLSLLLGVVFVGVTALTIGLWFTSQNADTTPVVDLGFFALGGVIITTGVIVQLWAPHQRIAGLQQAALGLGALALAGLLGSRIEPLTGGIVLLLAVAGLAALHPARHMFFAVGARPSTRLAALALLAAVPAAVYAAAMLAQARQAGPSCFLGRCAYGDRFAEMAALAIAVVAVGLLAAVRTQGWRIPAWSAGAAAVIAGVTSLVWPALPASLGRPGGALAVVWGAVFIAAAHWEHMRVALTGDSRLDAFR